MKTKLPKSRSELFLESSVKDMRAALPDLSMEQFVVKNLETLFGLEREEYLEQAPGDKGNGYYARSFQNLMKNGIRIEVPRTRTGGFAPIALQLFKMNQDQVNDLVLTLYKKGMTTRDIAEVMTDFFGNSVSHTTVANLAEQFHGIRAAWEKTPLDALYHAIFCDCIFITVRRGDSYSREAVYVCYGVTARNTRELLALAVNPTESTTTWKELFSSLKRRGVKNVSLVIADGITGMEDVVMEAWRKAKIQKCVVHKMRNVLNDIRPKDKAAVAEDLKHVFDNFDAGATKEQAYEKVAAFIAKWETTYTTIAKHFNEKTLEYYFTYLDFPPEVRRLIYTTNSIENLNKHIRKVRHAAGTAALGRRFALHIASVYTGYMKGGTFVHKRINITLPEETVRLLDRVSAKGDRSGLIDRAIKRYVEETGKANLRRRLKEGYERRAEHDLETAEAWFSLDEEVWSASK